MAAATAQAWNLIGGYTGYGAFGNVAFFGVGGYTTAIGMTTLKIDFLPAALLGGLIAALYAALLGVPILRLRGHYFSIATLGVAEATREIVANFNDLTGGGGGIPATRATGEGEAPPPAAGGAVPGRRRRT